MRTNLSTRRWVSLAVGALLFLMAAGFAAGQSAQPGVQSRPQEVQSVPDGAQSAQPQVQTEPLTAGDIMARVAENQDRSQALRLQYVYKQHIHIATHKPQTRMMREENADYAVVPQPDGTVKKQLKALTGRYWNKDKYVDFKASLCPSPAARMRIWFTTCATTRRCPKPAERMRI